MNFCESCGSELKPDAKFCSDCGENVIEKIITPEKIVETTAGPKEKTDFDVKEQLEKLQKIDYFKFLKETAINPSIATEKTGYNGWIQLFVLAALTTFAFNSIISGAYRMVSREMGGLMSLISNQTSSIMSGIKGELLPRLFIVSLVVYGVFFISAFLIKKFTTKSETESINEVVNQYSTLFTPNLIILVLASLFGFMGSEQTMIISMVLILLTFILNFSALTYYIYNNINVVGIDKIYTIVISNLLVITVLGVLLYLQLEPIIQLIDTLSHLGY